MYGNLQEQQQSSDPIGFKYLPAYNKETGRVLSSEWAKNNPKHAQVVIEEPGSAGIWPIYSLVEDTEL